MKPMNKITCKSYKLCQNAGTNTACTISDGSRCIDFLKIAIDSSSPEFAGSAKKLIGGEGWVVHILGMDDLFPQPDETTALKFANDHNIAMAKIPRKRNDPVILAIAYRSDEEP